MEQIVPLVGMRDVPREEGIISGPAYPRNLRRDWEEAFAAMWHICGLPKWFKPTPTTMDYVFKRTNIRYAIIKFAYSDRRKAVAETPINLDEEWPDLFNYIKKEFQRFNNGKKH